ncbi:box C/D snoRNA protein 1-like [Gossypium australe]|uniref:Box C/D snoRNA protein 1-like n=1 Tax=Gossypium australe TaxID=47621 RepID=A0A5B6VKK1_9ROSI|nr:box C/D snoRNA protein 1-like [Gossypium australe]
MVNLSGEAAKQWLEEEFSKSCCSLLIIISTDNLSQLVISIEQTVQLCVILKLLNYLRPWIHVILFG